MIKIQDQTNWIEDIVRESEHYFQGELQHEERASWLLGTASALILLIVNLLFSANEKSFLVLKEISVLIIMLLFLSAVFAVLALLPFSGIKHSNPWEIQKLINFANTTSTNEFIQKRFKPDEVWSETSHQAWIFHHFRSHYVRNLKKSRLIIWSSLFLLLALLISLIATVYLIIWSF